MASDTKPSAAENDTAEPQPAGHVCSACGIKLSSYNPGPNCWQHTIGNPWRGPSAKPRYD